MCTFESGSGSILDAADFGGLTMERKYTLEMVLIVIKGGEPVTLGESPNLQNGQNKIRTHSELRSTSQVTADGRLRIVYLYIVCVP